MLLKHLQPHFLPVPPAARGITSLRPLRPACAVLLSALAHAGNAGPAETETAFRQGGQMLGFAADDFLLHPLEECTFTALDAAFTELAGATPQIRRRVLEAAARTAATDGIIRAAEAELLRAFADALGCPAPLFPDPAQPA